MWKYAGVVFAFLILVGCQPTKTIVSPLKPTEFYSNAPENGISTFKVPVSIPLISLEELVNDLIQGVIYEDTQKEGDNLTIKVEKDGKIQFSAGNQVVNYSVPLKIHATYYFSLGFIQGSRDLDFRLSIHFATKLAIGQDWQPAPHTSYNGFTWITQPEVDLGGFKINASSLLGGAIDKQGDAVSALIDKSIHEKLDLRSMANQAWETIQQPSKVSDEYRLWVKILPQTIAPSTFTSLGKELTFDLSITAFAKTFIGKPKESALKIPLPFPSSNQLSDSGFVIQMATEIPFHELDTLANQMFKGKTFEFNDGKDKLTILGLHFYGSGNKMITEAWVDGSIQGKLYLSSTPYIDSVTQSLKLRNVNFDLKTKNILMQTAGWVLNNKIEKRIEKAFVFELKEMFGQTKEQLQGVLRNYKINNQVSMTGKVSDFYPKTIFLKSDILDIRTVAVGDLRIEVKSLR
ncbi:MAG: DUF4403 family protein [Cytophagales bacterium]|nr:DUF4403 family protein [Cytophagales bacterium]